AFVAPIRERRERLAADLGYVVGVLAEGTERARAVTQATLDAVRGALGTFSLDSVRELYAAAASRRAPRSMRSSTRTSS
ncbi:hypothetical protein PPH41_25750, partial [Burkholderia gladioli]|nr:hypothetical protein [Burkholderia gladioli]